VEARDFDRVCRKTCASLFYNGCHQTCPHRTPFGRRARGRVACTRESSDSTTIRQLVSRERVWIMSVVYLVSCVAAKRTYATRAKDLYVSEWFRRARDYVEAIGGPWFVLSAKYGLVAPDEVLEPYEQTLNTMSIAERRAWAARVQHQMDERLRQVDRIAVLAGQRYREFLMDYLRRRAPIVEVPLEGLRIGEQLSWFGHHGPSR
jgi:uncharacterized protein DUF6884